VIIVTPGSNLKVTPNYLRTKLDVLDGAGFILAQLEIPIDTIAWLADYCAQSGIYSAVRIAEALRSRWAVSGSMVSTLCCDWPSSAWLCSNHGFGLRLGRLHLGFGEEYLRSLLSHACCFDVAAARCVW
jgi:hypothetical protein